MRRRQLAAAALVALAFAGVALAVVLAGAGPWSGDAPDPDGTTPGGATQTDAPATPTPRDADVDRLHDGWEAADEHPDGYPLSGSDPEHKDLYLVLLVPEGVKPLTARERQDLTDTWAEMPVENPDGRTGITLHVEQRRLDEPVAYDGSDEAFARLRDRYYANRTVEGGTCVVHVGLLASMSGSGYGGAGSTPGYFFVVDGTATEDYDQAYTLRTAYVVHELLHNVVGTFEDGGGHTDEGWLVGGEGEDHGSQFYLDDRTAERLSTNGFDESAYYQQNLC